MTYQPAPEGVWRSTPEHILLWAIQGVLHKVTRAEPEAKHVAKWETRLRRALNEPVRSYRWERLWQEKKLVKAKRDDDPQVPRDIVNDWEETIGALLGGDQGLWRDAATVRTGAEGLPFQADEIDQAIENSMKLVRSIPDTAHDRLRTIMRDAYANADNQTGFAKAIRQEWAGVSKFKAEQIAVTEWNRMASQATLFAYKKQGVEYKRWFTAGDERVCSICENNGAEFDIPIGKSFGDGSDAPPAHPGCRCNISSG